MSLFSDPKFWVAVATTMFVVAVFKPFKKAIFDMLDARIKKVSSDLAEAAKLREDALKLLATAEKKLAESEDESKKIIEHAKLEADSIVKNTKSKLEKDIEIRKKLAVQKIENFEENALSEIKKSISNMTLLAAQTIFEENMDDETVAKLVTSSVEKIEKTLH